MPRRAHAQLPVQSTVLALEFGNGTRTEPKSLQRESGSVRGRAGMHGP